NPQYQLSYHICTYLGLPAPSPTKELAPTFICPGFEIIQPVGDISTNICYVVTEGGSVAYATGNLPKDSTWLPFGYDATSGPHRITEIQAEAGLPLSSVWMMCDVDQISVPNAGWSGQLPKTPCHVSVRNFVYFDNHVGTKHVGPTSYFYNLTIGPEY